MRPCIDLIDSLRALGVEQDLALPAIAVIGDQSSGKSSVLEALSGVALPRGSGKHSRASFPPQPAASHLGAPEHPWAQWFRRQALGRPLGGYFCQPWIPSPVTPPCPGFSILRRGTAGQSLGPSSGVWCWASLQAG